VVDISTFKVTTTLLQYTFPKLAHTVIEMFAYWISEFWSYSVTAWGV